MPNPRDDNLALVMTVLCCAAAMGMFLLPARPTHRIKSSVADMVAPLQSLARNRLIAWRSRWHGWKTGEEGEQLSALKIELESWQDRCTKLKVQTALLREQLQAIESAGASPYRSSGSEPLFVPQLLEARILAKETAEDWQAGLLLRGGPRDGMQSSLFVLESAPKGIGADLLIDQGTGAEIAPGMPVYAGRRVIGKIRHVGHWVSTVQPITDAEFRGHAQLARYTPRGLLLGAEGVLEGRGEELCRLKFIPASEAVTEGDEVFTGRRDGALPYPLSYGTVVKAELPQGKPHWEIWVRPAASSKSPRTTVDVLRTTMNSNRKMAN